MPIRDYLSLVRDGKWWIAAGLVVGVLGGLAFAVTSVPSYVASTTMYFASIEGGGEPGQAYQGALLAEQKARAYARLIVTDRILDEVTFDTGAPVDRSAITVQSEAGDPTLTVMVADPSAERAALVANTLAAKSVDLVAELERPRDPILSTVTTLRVLAPADVPTTAASPKRRVVVLVGGLIGACLGLAAAALRRSLDRSVRSREQVAEATGAPVLGGLPLDRSLRHGCSALADRAHAPLAEAVRQLRVNLRSAGVGDGLTSVLVTSASTGDGKTSVACDLAAAFGIEGDRVLLVDGNLRRPGVGSHLGVDAEDGLSTVLRGECSADDAVVTRGDGSFDVLASGPIPDDPSELLGSPDTAKMLAELGTRYDVVIVDSPALLAVSDASVLARVCDGTLLVTRYGRTQASDVVEAVATLRAVSARHLGCVVTAEPPRRRGVGDRARESA